MSAIQWLHFINPFIVITTMIALMTSVPLTAAWRQSLALPKKPLALKKTLMGAFGFTLTGWIMAYLAPHVMTPVIRINMVAFSQLILTLTLISIGVVVLVRLFQRNNLLSLPFIFIKRYVPIYAPIISSVVSKISLAFLIVFFKSNKHNKENENKNKEPLLDWNMNYRGEYCDKDKSNWY